VGRSRRGTPGRGRRSQGLRTGPPGSAGRRAYRRGPLTRWLPASPRTAPGAAAIAGFAAAAADLAVFILLASKLASTPAALAPAPVLAAAIASLVRLTLARRAARRCLTARAALSRA